jgi:hypothetical protein
MKAPFRVPISRLSLPVGLALVIACGGGDSNGPNKDIDGNWRGSASTQAFNIFADLTIADNNGNLSGTGSLSGTQACNNVDVAGHRSGSQVNLSMTCPGFQPINFSGSLSSSGTGVTGNISGSGFSTTPFDLIKQ